jgi:hypothetical protein
LPLGKQVDVECFPSSTRKRGLSSSVDSSSSVFVSALGEETIRRVRDGKHSSFILAISVSGFFRSDSA